jgi:NAD(P)-dependent dehydrogenase (short-subunit alcohol dehydrogenase family)
MNSLKGKVVLVTGASRGIGRAIALRLAREKARLAICSRDAVALAQVAREASALSGEEVLSRAFDLAGGQAARDNAALHEAIGEKAASEKTAAEKAAPEKATAEKAIADFCAAVRSKMGTPDILINNAGFNPRKAPVWEMTPDELDSLIAVNLKAPFLFIRQVLPDMIQRKAGHIVNILSSVCHYSNEGMGAYTAAKKGLDGLAGVLLKEARPHGIRVSAVYPGGTNTTFRAKERPDYTSPESVAEAVHAVLTLPEDLVVHGITFRPMVETNF